jgi:hypothetical protein
VSGGWSFFSSSRILLDSAATESLVLAGGLPLHPRKCEWPIRSQRIAVNLSKYTPTQWLLPEHVLVDGQCND